MKKIAIITFCHRDLLVNYGQVLQAFALQKILAKRGFDVLTISHKRRHLDQKEAYIREYFKPSLDNVQSRCFSKTTAFVDNNMKCVQTYGENDICRETKNADILICGSDAIWRAGHYDPAFYLDILHTEDKLKIAYAPSFVRYVEEDKNIIKKMGEKIKKIDYISTREQQGVRLLDEICGIKGVEVALDPALLWTEKEWSQYMSSSRLGPEESYIVLYLLDDTNEYDTMIEEVQKKHNAKRVITIFTGTILEHRNYIMDGIGPDDFLKLLYGAEAVLTNSFHGVAFSLIFHKIFYICKRYNYIVENDFRIKNLCAICSIQDKMVNSGKEIEKNQKYIDDNLEKCRINSINFLENAIKDIDGRKE